MADRLPFSRLTFDTAKGSQADQSIMGGAVGRALILILAVCTAVAIVTIACAGPLAGKAEARANIQDYLKGPDLFYPRFHDVNGSSTKLVIDTVGWNATRIAGNVGIGNGSVKTFDQTHTYDVEYPENEFMCGDVSTQPWVPGLKTEAPQVEAAAAENATGRTYCRAHPARAKTLRALPSLRVLASRVTSVAMPPGPPARTSPVAQKIKLTILQAKKLLTNRAGLPLPATNATNTAPENKELATAVCREPDLCGLSSHSISQPGKGRNVRASPVDVRHHLLRAAGLRAAGGAPGQRGDEVHGLRVLILS